MQKKEKSPKSMTGHAFTQFDFTKSLLQNLNKFKISPIAKLVLLELSACYNPKRADVFPKQKTLALKIGCSERSIIRAIQELFKGGLILVECKTTNRYIFSQCCLTSLGILNVSDNSEEKIFTSDKMSDINDKISDADDNLSVPYIHEQTKEETTQQKVVKIFPEKKQEIDKYLLKHVQSLQGIKNDEKFARWLMRTGQAEQIISDMKQAERNSKAMLKKTENLIKQQKEDAKNASAEMPEFFKDFGKRLKEYCQNVTKY